MTRPDSHWPSRSSGALLKRLVDLLLGGAALLVLSPLLLTLALLIRILDGSPVLFRQTRVGQGGVPFTIYKFRTMRNNGPNARPTDYTGGADWSRGVPDDFMFKSGKSPNLTRMGELLRRYSLDELPQFINVFEGTMSLVGRARRCPASPTTTTISSASASLQNPASPAWPKSAVGRDSARREDPPRRPLRAQLVLRPGHPHSLQDRPARSHWQGLGLRRPEAIS
jgi:lipopolysaccharide/colanic/teichoic acid biosynthesis glycosyltransferase